MNKVILARDIFYGDCLLMTFWLFQIGSGFTYKVKRVNIYRTINHSVSSE